ncbi:MAG TPA: hypothetical protein VMF69_22640 [Gemmataceae bacterium]|nr:hypothetical protein [Gemmataceae bacterium]
MNQTENSNGANRKIESGNSTSFAVALAAPSCYIRLLPSANEPEA